MKLEFLEDQKLTEPKFSEKLSFSGKSPKMSPEKVFLGFHKN